MLTHAQVWTGIDALARRFDMSPSALARSAGLDPTSFNRSKRASSDTPPRPRWPSTESLAKVLAATGVGLAEFGDLAAGRSAASPRSAVPLLGFAQAGRDGFFDDAGFPAGEGWDEVEAPGAGEGTYALEIAGTSMEPVFRDGDVVIVSPAAPIRRGDRVVVRTVAGEVMGI